MVCCSLPSCIKHCKHFLAKNAGVENKRQILEEDQLFSGESGSSDNEVAELEGYIHLLCLTEPVRQMDNLYVYIALFLYILSQIHVSYWL